MNKRYFIYGMLTFTLAISNNAMAQEEEQKKSTKKKVEMPAYPTMEVKGTVIDEATKQPLAGVQVNALQDKRYAAMSDENGNFTIKVPQFTTALYLYTTQYLPLQVAIAPDNTVEARMLTDKFRNMYQESVGNTAQTTMQVKSTTSVSVETDIENNIGADVRTVTRSGAPGIGAAMFIRGINSINSNTQPLIVVDGVIQDMQTTRTSLHDGDYNNLMMNVNPDEIEKVTVLKNATALYGAKGGNGVILIDTKRGRSMATRIEANIGATVSLVPKLPKMMNTAQYRLYATDILGSYPYSGTESVTLNFLNDDLSGYYYNMYHNNTDWTKETYHTAISQKYNINVQGGDNIGMYNLSLGYTNGQSTLKENSFNRLNVRFNTDLKILPILKTRFDVTYTKLNRNVFDDGAQEYFSASTVTAPGFLSLIKAPFLNPYMYSPSTRQLTGILSDADDFLQPLTGDESLSLANPTALLENGKGVNKNRTENTYFSVTIAPVLDITKGLRLSDTFNYTLNRNSQRYYRPTGGVPNFLISNIGWVQTMAVSLFNKQQSISNDTRLQWDKNLGAHNLSIFGGFRYTNLAFDGNTPQGQYTSAGTDNMPNISGDMDYKEATGDDDKSKSITWYANADYNYKNRYFLTASLAMETNSRFGKEADGLKLAGVRWGLFPGIQGAWVITNESWFTKKGIDFLKIYAGYDISGNDDINNYSARTSFLVKRYLYNISSIQLSNIGNEKIQWEKTGKFNVGIQAFMLHNRLGVNFDYYIHKTSNLLTLKTFETSVAGVNNYWSNGGSLQNNGFELTITGKPLVSKDWNIEAGFSIGKYKNKIKELPDNDMIYVDGQLTQGYSSSIYGTNNIATLVGYAAGTFYGYKTEGVFASDEEALAAGKGTYLYQTDETGAKEYFKAGDVHFTDINGDGVIDEKDKTVIGNPNPSIYGNIFATVSYKNLSLNLGFNYSVGNDVYNYQRSILESGSNFYNQTTAMVNRWSYEGQTTTMPKANYGDPMGNSRFSDRWIEDGSYLRLKTVNITYKVPMHLSWLQGLTVWAEASNLFTITHYLGGDPEFSASNKALYQGIDTGTLYQGRAFTLGLKVNL